MQRAAMKFLAALIILATAEGALVAQVGVTSSVAQITTTTLAA